MDHYQLENNFLGSVRFEGTTDLGGFIEVLEQRGIVPAIVANETARANYLDKWMDVKGVPPSRTNPCVVFREDGSMTGLLEICVDSANEQWSPLSDPPGTLKTTMSTTAPYGWFLCEGQLLTPSDPGHAALYANCPALREGANVRLPDMRARTTVGAGPRLTSGKPARGIGDTGGLEEVKLSKNETPLVDHLHGGFNIDARVAQWFDRARILLGANSSSDPSGAGVQLATLNGNTLQRDIIYPNPPTGGSGTALDPASGVSRTWPTTTSGRNALAAHENMPPFLAVNYLIKA